MAFVKLMVTERDIVKVLKMAHTKLLDLVMVQSSVDLMVTVKLMEYRREIMMASLMVVVLVSHLDCKKGDHWADMMV
jgi:hypothetical protein